MVEGGLSVRRSERHDWKQRKGSSMRSRRKVAMESALARSEWQRPRWRCERRHMRRGERVVRKVGMGMGMGMRLLVMVVLLLLLLMLGTVRVLRWQSMGATVCPRCWRWQ